MEVHADAELEKARKTIDESRARNVSEGWSEIKAVLDRRNLQIQVFVQAECGADGVTRHKPGWQIVPM